jgi:hypothetical protein
MPARVRRPEYRVYLLRLWKEPGAPPGAGADWRFSLESPHTNERYGFTSIAALAEFLRDAISAPAAQAEQAASQPSAPHDPDHSRAPGEAAAQPSAEPGDQTRT